MPEPGGTHSERGFQRRFTIGDLLACLILFAIIVGWNRLKPETPDRQPRPPAVVAVHYRPVMLDGRNLRPLRLVGAWVAEAADPRFGGVSALAIDGDRLLAITDAGVLIRLPRPGSGISQAEIRDLPDGPGSPWFKKNRDSEALAADPARRGWWVAFEYRHELWLFDRDWCRVLARGPIPATNFSRNRGIEAMAPLGRNLLLLAENGDSAFTLRDGRVTPAPLRNRFGSLSEAAALPDGSVLVVARGFSLTGLDNRLLRLAPGRLETSELARLPLGPFDNVEALAAERSRPGRIRLWLMTDNDFSRQRPTLLLALEMPG